MFPAVAHGVNVVEGAEVFVGGCWDVVGVVVCLRDFVFVVGIVVVGGRNLTVVERIIVVVV